jgi:hypothetical protein
MNLLCKLFGHKYIVVQNVFAPTMLICQRCGKAIKFSSQLYGTKTWRMVFDDVMKNTKKDEDKS